MGFPTSGIRAPFTPDVGNLLVLSPGNPAAGANLTLTIPPAKWTQIYSVQFTLATDANAANRYVNVDYIGFGSLQNLRNAATVLVTANTSATMFQFDTAHTVSEWQTGTTIYAPLVPLPLGPGWSVRITVDSIQAGDQIASAKVVLLQFYEEDEEN